ncbi:hypothetical protein STA3757_35880 [Stanieria sp. NIES-3757]|nr:hypothetical protein STA3757_35880 [Stanieria sp. NIES-3757]
MNKLNRKLTRTRGLNRIQPREMSVATFALALTVGASTLATPQPASAQIVELAGAALGAIFNRPPKPIPNQNYSFATNNLNGNTFSLGNSPARLPVSAPIPPQGSISQSTVTNQVGTIPPGVVPGAVPSGVVQPTPPRPTVVIPLIKLPINLPL